MYLKPRPSMTRRPLSAWLFAHLWKIVSTATRTTTVGTQQLPRYQWDISAPLQKHIGCDDAPNCPEANLQAGCNTKAFSINFSGNIWPALSLKGQRIYKKTLRSSTLPSNIIRLVGQWCRHIPRAPRNAQKGAKMPYALALTVLDKHQPHEGCDGLERHHCSALVQFIRYF